MNLTNAELSDLFSEMEGLIRAGIPLSEYKSPAKGRLDKLWSRISREIAQGQSISSSLEKEIKDCSPEALALIRAGEQSGDLLTPLRIAAESHRRTLSLERCMRLTFFYPVIVFIFAIGILLFYGWVILPGFMVNLQTLGYDEVFAPGLYPVLDMARAMGTPMGTVITVSVVVGLTILINSSAWMSPFVRTRFLGNIPPLGRIMAFGSITRWTHVLGHLLKTKVPMDTALEIAQGTLQFPEQRQAAAQIRETVQKGQPLSTALLNNPLLPPATAGVISGGEKAGTVDEALVSISDHLQQRLDHDTQRFLLWLEPLLILFVGLLVMALIASLFMPLFELPKAISRI